MKEYIKPTCEFVELKPEERLACGSGGPPKKNYFIFSCGSSSPFGMNKCKPSNFKTICGINYCR